MGFYVRLDKFGVAQANHLLAGGYNRVDAMGDKEIRVKLIAGDFVLVINDAGTEKTVEKTRSQERTYHGQAALDENNPIYIPFNVFAAATSVKLKLWGVNFPSYHYTEMPAHNHGGQVFASSTHTHGVSGSSAAEALHTHAQAAHSHTWSDSATTGTAGAHAHTCGVQSAGHDHNYSPGTGAIVATGGQSNSHQHGIGTEPVHSHSVSVSGTTSAATPVIGAGSSHLHAISLTSGAPSATDAIPSQGISGGTLNDTAKVQVDTLIQLFITAVQGTWGTVKDKNTATPVDFSTLANINNNGGTAEFDIFSYVTAGGFNYIKINEPTVKKGGTILWHLSVS